MTLTSILLVLVSAFVHAGWNLLGKRSGANGAYFGIAGATGFLVMIPVFLLWNDTVRAMPGVLWLYLGATGFFQALYFVGLAGAYRTGDLSVAYPVARAFPVLIVPFIAVALGTGLLPSGIALVGMVVVAAGLLVIPGGRFSRTSLLYALVAGIGTAGYSIIDDAALAVFRDVAGGGLAIRAPMIYSGFQSLSTAIILSVSTVFRHGRTGYVRELKTTSVRSAVAAGGAIIVAYCLVLVAYGFATNVGYVVAFRQVSLPIGTVLGVFVLRETTNTTRLLGTALIIVGLVLVGIG